MANYFERVSVFIDVKAEKATAALGKFKAAMSEAQGFTAKSKVALSGIGDALKASVATPTAFIGTMAAAAGTAATVGKVLYDLANEFEKTALEADNFGKAVGLSVEDASRWIAVGDDYGISAETMQGALSKVTKGLKTLPFKDYGISVEDASGKQRSMNDILIDTIGTIGEIKNPSLQAAAGTDLLGRAYKDITPLIGLSKDELEKYLHKVAESQIVTQGQVDKAHELQAAQDNLSDTWRESKKNAGEFAVPIITKTLNQANLAYHAVFHPMDTFDRMLSRGKYAIVDNAQSMKYLREQHQMFAIEHHRDSKSVEEMAQARLDAANAAQREAEKVKALAEETKRLVEQRLRDLDTTQSVERARLTEGDAIDNVVRAQKEWNDAQHDPKISKEDKAKALRDLRRANLDAAAAIVATAEAEVKRKGYAEGSNEALNTELGYLEEAKKKYPQLKTDIDNYADAIRNVPTFIPTNLTGYQAPVAGFGPGSSAIVPPPINITVNGALDPTAVAKQIDRMLRNLYSGGGGLGVSIYGQRYK